MTAREKQLEHKIVVLESRLALVERFVELRFCETFQDFRIRNSKGKSGASKPRDDDDQGGNDNGEENPEDSESSTPRQPRKKGTAGKSGGNGSSSNRPAPARIKAQREVNKKTLVIELKKLSSAETSGSRRYGTRRQTRLADEPVIKQEIPPSSPVGSVTDMDSESVIENHEGFDNHDNQEDEMEESYFTFPGDGGNESNPLEEVENNNDNDRDWSGDDIDDDDTEDYKPRKSEIKGKSTKRKRSSISKTGSKRKRASEPKKKNRHLYYKASVKDLSESTPILSSDSTRAECPICRQHWKVEMLEQHIATHSREKHLKCPHCDKQYSLNSDLRNHIQKYHNRDSFPKCRICDVPQVRKMIYHEKYCVKRAITKGEEVDPALVQNIRELCAAEGLEFVLPDETVPEGMDPGERVKCSVCNRHFQRRHITRHLASHSLPRNWKCCKCPKTYIHKHDLIRHVAITHEVELKCNLCGERCETRQDLHLHIVKCRKERGLPYIPRSDEGEGTPVGRKAGDLPFSFADDSSLSAPGEETQEMSGKDKADDTVVESTS